VRQEAGGKHLLLGVLLGPAKVPNFPAIIKIAALIDIVAEQKVTLQIEVRWAVNGETQATGHFPAETDPPNHLAVACPPAFLTVTQPSEITLEVRAQSGEWVVAESTFIGQ
jgi:hypothetical protein